MFNVFERRTVIFLLATVDSRVSESKDTCLCIPVHDRRDILGDLWEGEGGCGPVSITNCVIHGVVHEAVLFHVNILVLFLFH